MVFIKIKDMTGFVYKWVNNLNGKWYSGSHKGTPDDGYVGSGTVFDSALAKHGIENFTRHIIYEGPDYRLVEELHLISHDAKNNPMSYNLKNEALGGNGLSGKDHPLFGVEREGFAGENHPNWNVKQSQEVIDKRLASRRAGKGWGKQSPETIAKKVATYKRNQKMRDEAGITRRKQSPEHAAKRAASKKRNRELKKEMNYEENSKAFLPDSQKNTE